MEVPTGNRRILRERVARIVRTQNGPASAGPFLREE
jgi:hypothetical protein